MERVKLQNLEAVLEPLFHLWRRERQTGEAFGDFTHKLVSSLWFLRKICTPNVSHMVQQTFWLYSITWHLHIEDVFQSQQLRVVPDSFLAAMWAGFCSFEGLHWLLQRLKQSEGANCWVNSTIFSSPDIRPNLNLWWKKLGWMWPQRLLFHEWLQPLRTDWPWRSATMGGMPKSISWPRVDFFHPSLTGHRSFS
jgi:hypothetical protein